MDIITVCAAYHHFPDTAAFAHESKRVLKLNGRVYIAEIYLPFPLRLFLNPFVPLSSEGDAKFYSPEMICRNFEQCGFKRESVKISGNVQIVSMVAEGER
jgi:SAM-dependent methyltransferase